MLYVIYMLYIYDLHALISDALERAILGFTEMSTSPS